MGFDMAVRTFHESCELGGRTKGANLMPLNDSLTLKKYIECIFKDCHASV